MNGLEIERKYLIRMPPEASLRAKAGCETWDILQIYLTDTADGDTRRIRRVREGGREIYYYTQKRHISALTQRENEWEISAAEFASMRAEADAELRPIEKRRLRIPYMDQLLEVDIYSFWQDRATMEIEMESEDQRVFLPNWIEVVREVTDDRRYKNKRLAKTVPMEDIG